MNSKKLIAAMSILIALTLALAGCGKKQSPAAVKDYDDAPHATLSVLTGTSLSDDVWNEGFTASDGTQINVIEYSSEYYEKENLSYRDLLLKRLESNVDVDFYVIHAEDVIDFARKNYWMDLSDIDAVNSLSEDALWQSTYDGKVFSIPLTYTGFGFYWNIDLLKEHGLSVPKNLSEFTHVCDALVAAGITPYLANKGYALTVPAMAVGFAEVYASDDSEQLLAKLADGSTPVSEYMADGFAFIEMMIQKGYFDPQKALEITPRDGDIAGFRAGECAFICCTLQPMDGLEFEWTLTGVPVLEDGEVAVVGANYRMSVNPNSPNVGYAVELLNSLVTPEWLADIAAHDQTLSSGKGEYDLKYLPEASRDFAILVQSGNQIPNQDFSFPFNTWEAIRDLCREICAGKAAADVTLDYDRIQNEQIEAAR